MLRDFFAAGFSLPLTHTHTHMLRDFLGLIIEIVYVQESSYDDAEEPQSDASYRTEPDSPVSVQERPVRIHTVLCIFVCACVCVCVCEHVYVYVSMCMCMCMCM